VKKFFLLLFVTIQSGCAFFLSYIKDKKPSAAETSEASAANKFMWQQFQLGNYDSIPVILDKLNAAYELDPNDADVSAHLGFIYLWAFAERNRNDQSERMIENIFLSNRFFKEATVLNPNDARLNGFQSAVQMCEGALTYNLELLAKSYFSSLKAIRKWPQFNKFALGYIESQLDSGSRMFEQGLKYQWEILDECAAANLTEAKIMKGTDKVFYDLYREINESSDQEIKRACGNSRIVPHNWEGFFLNFGDMLVKAGKFQQAKVMYEATKISPSWNEWVYKGEIANRIEEMNLNVVAFNRVQKPLALSGKRQMMINSEMSCTGCHQMSSNEFAKARDQRTPDVVSSLKEIN
jgi:hypothetical protein